MIGILAEDHDAHVLGWRQVECPEPFRTLGEDTFPVGLLIDEEALELRHIRLRELGAQPVEPAMLQLDLICCVCRHCERSEAIQKEGWPERGLDCHGPSALAMTGVGMESLVSTDWLADHLG